MIFFNMMPKAQIIQVKHNKRDYIKLTSFCTEKNKKTNEKAPHIMEATFFKTSVGLGVNIQSIKTSINLKQQKCL